jgi:hypothetical protein
VQFEHNNIFSLDNWLIVFLRHYYSQYDLSRLFVDGFGGGQSIHPAGIGQLFWLEVFLWLAGIIGLAKQRLIRTSGFNLTFLLGWWFLIWPIAAAVTVSGVPTETRTINFLPLPELLAGYGAAILLNEARERSKTLKRVTIYSVLGAASLVYIGYNAYFLSEFFSSNSYPSMTVGEVGVLPYNIGLEPVLQAVVPIANDCDAIWLANWGNSQPYIYYLFFTKYPPAKYQAAVRYETDLMADEFNYVLQFGNVRVAAVDTILDPNNAPFIPPSCSASENTFIIVHQELVEPDLYEVASSKSPSGVTIWAAYLKINPKPN